MKKLPWLARAAAATVLVGAVGVGAATVALKVFFPEPKLRAWVVAEARRRLGREVRLEGIGLSPRGLTLSGLEVAEGPDFSAGPFVKIDSFRLRPSWSALLRRRLVVASASADGLSLRATRGADGRWNYATIGASTAAASAPARPSDAPATELAIRRLRLTRATIVYDDGSGAPWTVSEADLEASGIGGTGPIALTATLRARGTAGGRPVDARLSYDGTVTPGAAFSADARRFKVEQDGLTLSGSAKYADGGAAFDAALAAAGKTVLTAKGTAKFGAATDLDATLKSPGLPTALLAKLAPGAGLPPFDLPALDASVAGTFGGGAASVRAFSASWPGGKVEGAGSAKGLGGASPSYEGRAAFGVDAPALSASAQPWLKLPPKLSLPAFRLDGKAALAGGTLTVTDAVAKLPQGTVAVSGVVRGVLTGKPVPDASANLALDLPAFKVGDLPFVVSGVAPTFVVPASRLDGTARVAGDDLRFEKLRAKFSAGSLSLDGTVAKALAGASRPDLSVAADLSLPALTDKDLPFAGAPAGLKLPASRWTADLSYSPAVLKLRSLRAKIGGNDLELTGTVSDPGGRAGLDLLAKCRSFSLPEITDATPKTRELQLAGTGYFALSATGTKDKPIYAGKAQFRGLGATVAGLPLSGFSGTVSFDERRVDLPNLSGRVADGTLKMDLTVKEYASRTPEVQLEAELDRFDLGRWLDAKKKLADERKAPGSDAAAGADKGPSATTRGHFRAGTVVYTNSSVEAVKVEWDLKGVGADLSRLDGTAQLHVGGGRVRSLGDLVLRSVLAKILLSPLIVIQHIGAVLGGRVFPNLNDFALNQMVGDYSFSKGLMTLNKSEIDTDVAQVSAKGTIDLPAEKQDLLVTTQALNIAPLDVAVTGTFDKPVTKAKVGKFLTDGARGILDAIQGR